MDAAFIEILKKIVVKRGSGTLFDAEQCRAILADYTRNEFKKERNLLLLAVTSGAAQSIYVADDLKTCKSQQIWQLEKDYSLTRSAAAEVVDMLALILRGERIAGVNFTESQFGIDMVFAEGGTFIMGETLEQGDGHDNAKPVHQVTLSDFYIGKYPVTQMQWCAVMGNNPSGFTGEDNLPVERVSWNDAQEFIKRLNGLIGGNYRLPTEAEWEYAARGGKQSGGYKYSGSNTIDEVAWYKDNSEGFKTRPVGKKRANELGIYDMSGNVFEWASDLYGDYASSPQTNPKGPIMGSYRVSRGGSWFFPAQLAQVSARFSYAPDTRFGFIGFRLALNS